MSGFSVVDLSRLPAPKVVQPLDFELILGDIKAEFLRLAPDYAPLLDLESEPLVMLMQAVSNTLLHKRQEFNDDAKGLMLAYATGADLDQLAALLGVERLLVDAGDAAAVPPIPPTLESDDRLRERTQMALEGFSTAGSNSSYQFWGMSASADVKDVGVMSPSLGSVLISVLSILGDGTAPAGLLDAVNAAVNADDVRPLTDQVTVSSAEIVPYQVTATLTFYAWQDSELSRLAAEAAVREYIELHHRLGHDITRSGLFAALHQAGVQNVLLASPAADIVVTEIQAAYCTAVSVTAGGISE